MIACGKTDIGKVRVSNQDAFCIHELSDGAILAVVCDGMGGANAGNVASEQAANAISAFFKRSYRKGMSANDVLHMLSSAIISANIEVYDMSLKDPALQGMGTTVVATVASPEYTVVAHVGDSRAYLSGDELTQLTRDHSVVQSMIESGKLTPEEARVHPRKNVITRALGIEEEVMVDTAEYPPLGENQALLVCTDGLSNYIEPDAIKEIIDGNAYERAVEVLVARANHNGGGDNITAVIVAAEQKG